VYVPIDYDCDFDPSGILRDIIKDREKLPTLLNIHPNMDKIIHYYLKDSE